jgi:Sensors of blue-light using FAD
VRLHQLVYYSRNQTRGTDRDLLQQLRDIVSVSQRNNQRDGITGYLIFDKTWFLQILEGQRETIFRTFQRIERDSRHNHVVLAQTRQIHERQFPSWTMGGSMRTPEKQEVFLRHGVGGPIDPTKLKPYEILALALDLQDYEVTQRAAARLAS